jgi:hypothetical protein
MTELAAYRAVIDDLGPQIRQESYGVGDRIGGGSD